MPIILVAEDCSLLGEIIADHLRDWGMEPLGPVGQLEEACQLAQQAALDGALLDVKLGNALSFPIAAILKLRGVRFAFLTGYGGMARIPLDFRGAPLLHKPFAIPELKEAVGSLPLPPAIRSGVAICMWRTLGSATC